jgi:glutamate/aspartate transport system permease protein
MAYDFDWSTIPRALPYLMEGMQTTLLLLGVGMALGIVLGTLLAIVRLFAPRPLAVVAAGYVNFFRSIPLILTIFWFYFLVPLVLRAVTGDPNLTVGPIYAAIAAFTLAEAAYYCEIMRAGIGSVSRGQLNAAQALGMTSWQALRLVVLPQAFRNMTPSLVNQSVALLKDTSLVYVISLGDFLGAASKLGQRDGRLVEMYLFVAGVYLLLCTMGAWLVDVLQRRRVRKPVSRPVTNGAFRRAPRAEEA